MTGKKVRGVAMRPRVFDMNTALDQALKIFWQHGYEGASLSNLTRAMGINRSSMYSTFGNKETLFHMALERYIEGPLAVISKALNEPTARAVVEKVLRVTAEAYTNPQTPLGCLTVQGALACGKESDPIRLELSERRMMIEVALRERLEQAKSSGDLPADSDPATLARYIITIIQGMAVQSTSGTSHEELQQVVEMALRSWPT